MQLATSRMTNSSLPVMKYLVLAAFTAFTFAAPSGLLSADLPSGFRGKNTGIGSWFLANDGVGTNGNSWYIH